MAKIVVNTAVALGWISDLIDSDNSRRTLRFWIWLRRLFVLGWVIQYNYRLDFTHLPYILNMIIAGVLLVANEYVSYRIRSEKTVIAGWALLLSILDVLAITLGLIISGGIDSPGFVMYYAAAAAFAVLFSSFKLSMSWVSIAAIVYVTVSLAVPPGIDFESKDEKVLFLRIMTMYGVVAAVSLISRVERVRRREAVERERELQQERVELSQTIHDTIAQSAYMIDLGVESAMDLVDDSHQELISKLQATHSLSKSSLWELRHPIESGAIFDGRELHRVLRSHAAAFTTITSIPAGLVVHGDEPPLPAITRRLLFSVAHNAMTNAFRHAHPTRVDIALRFDRAELSMSVSDDGIGLPPDYEDRGHGFRNMKADVHRLGGALEASSAPNGRGTIITCLVPYPKSDRG